jgi:RNA polymerase sigma factor (sigma-70 family)
MQYLRLSIVYTGMATLSASDTSMADRNARITEVVSRERTRLRDFIRRRVPDAGDAEDILQDVLFEFVDAYRLPDSIEQVGAWLYRVARNRIIDRFRRKKTEPLPEPQGEDDDTRMMPSVLSSLAAGPEAAYARRAMIDALSAALAALPPEQRDVFIAHELEGRSFAELAADTGVPLNTLLARKRYAVLRLRERLQAIYDDFNF